MVKNETSAGGIVYKKENNHLYILVSQHSGHHGWVFPKGIVGDEKKEETKEEAAVREVKEETGIEGRILASLPPITYFYRLEGETIRKSVFYFLMEFVSGDFSQHSWEMEKVEWEPLEKVEERLTYKSDKEIFGKARAELVKLAA